MMLKTYLSSTIEAAVALASRELGPEAMLMSSRLAPLDVQHLGRYEVVFAAADPSFDTVLEESGVEPALIERLLQEPPANLAAHMQSMVSTSAALSDTVALVGPPGRGKSSTLLKLAVKYGLSARRPVRILSADNRRFGSSFSATLGVEFETFETARELDRALALPSRALTFIDTSRHTHAERDLARVLNSHAADVHLVLRADAPTAGLLRMFHLYRSFEPSRLIFTGLDEVQTYGNLFSAAVEIQRPVSFFCAGQRIPEDLETPTPARLVDLVLNRKALLQRAA